jgi:hypothetical protein
MYSWNENALREAEAQYGKAVAEAVRNAIEARNQLAINRADAMNAFYGGQYASASKIEKFGWTGGAASDERMRMAYLNATIMSTMYNQKELILAGYDSELAIAREYANLNLMQLANEKYQEALNNARELAKITGIYVSPEASDIATQYLVASQNPSDPRNETILNSVRQWYTAQGLTEEEWREFVNYYGRYASYVNSIQMNLWQSSEIYAQLTEQPTQNLTPGPGGGIVDDDDDDDDDDVDDDDDDTKNLSDILSSDSHIVENNILKINGNVTGQIVNGKVLYENKDTGYRVDANGNVRRVNVRKEASNDAAASLLNEFNSTKTTFTNWTQAELFEILKMSPTQFEPLYSGGPATGGLGRIRGYRVPRTDANAWNRTLEISVEQYNYLMENWWLK